MKWIYILEILFPLFFFFFFSRPHSSLPITDHPLSSETGSVSRSLYHLLGLHSIGHFKLSLRPPVERPVVSWVH